MQISVTQRQKQDSLGPHEEMLSCALIASMQQSHFFHCSVQLMGFATMLNEYGFRPSWGGM